MPYYITTNAKGVSFPEECPYCRLRTANTFRTFNYVKHDTAILGSPRGQTCPVSLPTCETCLQKGKNLFKAAIVSFVLMFLFPFTVHQLGFENPERFFVGFLVTFLVLIIWRNNHFRSFLVAHMTDHEITLKSTKRDYAEKLALANQVEAQKKMFFFRIR